MEVKIQKSWRLKIEPWRAVDAHSGDLEARNKTLGVCRPVVADSHHFEEKLAQDPDPHYSEKLDPDLH